VYPIPFRNDRAISVGNFATKLVAMATSLEILKNNSDLSSAPKALLYGVIIAKIARGLCFAYNIKLFAMATSLEESEKRPDRENSRKYLPFGEKVVKIGPVDTEIALLIVKKEEIYASKIYSPVGSFAEQAK